jgi:outer membrane immunogenic protein
MKTLLHKLWPAIAVAVIIGGAAHEYAYGSDLPIYKAPQRVADAASPGYNWNRWYGGAFVGYGQGDGTATLNNYTCPECSERKLERANENETGVGPDLRMDGLVFGIQAGRDVMLSQGIVAGIVGDVAWSGIRGAASLGSMQLTRKLTWLGNLDLRVGVLPVDNLLVYVIGGLSVGGVKNSLNAFGSPGGYVGALYTETNHSSSDTKWGWNIGAGVEGVLDRKNGISVYTDVRYISLQSSNLSVPGYICEDPAVANITGDNKFTVFRVGLNKTF